MGCMRWITSQRDNPLTDMQNRVLLLVRRVKSVWQLQEGVGGLYRW